MANIYNYLKTVFQKLKQENSQHPSLVFIVLVLLTIPLSYTINGIAVALLMGSSLVYFGIKNYNRVNIYLLIPLLIYGLMVMSLLWTRDFSVSLQALSKELPFLIIPTSFLIFPVLTEVQKQKVFRFYGYGMVVFVFYYLFKALIRFVINKDVSVFFYHELVTQDVNAIHVSVYISVAFFYFLTKANWSFLDKLILLLFAAFLLLLSSKNIIVVFLALIIYYFLVFSKIRFNTKAIWFGVVILLFFGILFSSKIKERFFVEIHTNTVENSVNTSIKEGNVYNISVNQAWNKQRFETNQYFPGTALRVYQIRIFKEMLLEDPIFLTGYGLNASTFKIIEKRKEHNLYFGYDNFNFHNQYIQFFAELGIFGLVLIITMLVLNLKNALKSKDFIHISFSILMISLFLTESFLSRQRGIVFFTIMYCLFNSGSTIAIQTKNNK